MKKIMSILVFLLLTNLCWAYVAKETYQKSNCGPSEVTSDFPNSGAIRLDKKMPAEVRLNKPFTYEIKITNTTDSAITNIVVREQLDDGYSYISSTPPATVEGNTLVWETAELKKKGNGIITVTGTAKKARCLRNCVDVTFSKKMSLCSNVKVVNPKLQLKKTAPAEVVICDPIDVELVVTNNGSGMTDEVRIVDKLPQGLTTKDGKKEIVINAGKLKAGESKQFKATLRAEKTGQYVNKAVATAGDLTANASTTTIVKKPVLTITKSAPKKSYVGSSITYDITVTNTGDAPANMLVIKDAVPRGTRFVSATNGGKLSGDNVVWNLGTLKANFKNTVSMTVLPGASGVVLNTASARAVCAESVKSSASTNVMGIPAILLEVIDVKDPVQIGKETTYVITATNQGSATGTNIEIECVLENNMEYVSSSGATTGRLDGDSVKFAGLKNLAPKAKATWNVVVKAVKEGDVRFKVIMNTEQLERPVEETEATRLYE